MHINGETPAAAAALDELESSINCGGSNWNARVASLCATIRAALAAPAAAAPAEPAAFRKWVGEQWVLYLPGDGLFEAELSNPTGAEPLGPLATRAAAPAPQSLGAYRRFVPAILAAMQEIEDREDDGDGNAPGHGHRVPGIWDDDNGERAGKPCAWCALWRAAKEARAALAQADAPKAEVEAAGSTSRAAAPAPEPASEFTARGYDPLGAIALACEKKGGAK